jgi:hypothetical protein
MTRFVLNQFCRSRAASVSFIFRLIAKKIAIQIYTQNSFKVLKMSATTTTTIEAKSTKESAHVLPITVEFTYETSTSPITSLTNKFQWRPRDAILKQTKA